VTKPYKQ